MYCFSKGWGYVCTIKTKLHSGGDRVTSQKMLSNIAPGVFIEFHEEYSICENNVIELNPIQMIKEDGNVIIKVRGTDNYLSIGHGNKVNRTVNIGFSATVDKMAKGTSIIIGNNNFFNGRLYVASAVEEGVSLEIGNCNLFADYILLKALNDHGIFDVNTGKRLNHDADVFIGDKNWIGRDVSIFPKSYIAGNSVVGAYSFVNKRFGEKNILIAGSPATIKRRNIMWNCSNREEIFSEYSTEPLAVHGMFSDTWQGDEK